MPQALKSPHAQRPALESRHQPSGLNSCFCGGNSNFADYVESSRQMLEKAHAGTESRDRDEGVAGNTPFESRPQGEFPAGRQRPYLRGVLLIHGLTDSPYAMRHLASLFAQRGFRIMAVLLPGHGTQPGDLLDVRWQEWARAAAYGVEQLAAEVDEVYLAGYSAGATLAIRQSLLDERVRGLFLFSPAIGISPRAAWANLHKAYSWLIPRAKWVDIKPDRDRYKYESFPKNAAFQMHALTQDLRRQLRRKDLTIPVFTAASADDVTVDIAATLQFMAGTKHHGNRLIYYTTDVLKYPDGIPRSQVVLVNSTVPEQGILSFSHLSIVMPPEDPHYGAAGEYANCLHYYPDDMTSYGICSKRSSPVLQGEVTEQNLGAGILRRLTYNPHFAALGTAMQEFIANLP